MHKLISLFSCCLLSCMLYATSVRVEPLEGVGKEMAISTIGRILFNGDNLVFVDKQQTVLYSIAIAEIGTMTFTEDEPQALPDMPAYAIYPNPTHSYLVIDGIDAQTPVRIYDLQGRLVLSGMGSPLHIDPLAAGNYLLQVNHQIVKIIKE